ncbi:UDP-N-acetylmuramoyl-tripeptide--D-alanyl-D-alanine ligase [Streptococcus mutans]|jgi:UDP-N-acetylmuramoyl-tripeptide--D-alanyl-D-alanine ligase|uniref:UDP-N-acetylmuramoyl-tripeptide--D-alanyl-D-alanine ligase n=1 Tax=Streptococcus mutans serotype c (strain ATCC 700610 / UA159) TaxID=210007 RepID=Q8DV96_STRMU|nr:UDP-N-acetylmuramoyl-tripeptide--D-alanyl-D-alanine ligase [Streptococcus mutans]AAN58341.1 putative D-Ala-D-Ala adding enzyme; UDP-N-acetylmuramoylalanyl-D-glutamyl-2,6- diaminopimelate-D-alanyl-D-alanyl ligase pentapeptide synthase [Streptococcus mutans UA159]AJD54998.1 UDP-N-acetylmuramoylalanyl-D-glutamyl-2,6- diaminopimelate-D-alanyl-D-alanyl ligase pentapeptide synthase [Streptococcus mutans UA159-FR]EMB57584.1 putative D-Ala-D-Ala adding enzyme [Streptococcus mutans 8ID3]EMB80354.1 pu
MKLTLQEIASVVGAQNDVSLFEDLTINAIEFDSRQIKTGDLFLPLQGARDGHEFIDTAFANGAVATFSEKNITSDYPYILVVDCLKAFQDLAQYYLEKMRVDVIAVTGSNGKTTTKDMIATILATTYKTYKTQGNYNNEIGLPYTVLHMPDDTEKIVLEMGQDHLGDIALLSNLTHPHIAVVTLIGEAHLEFFGSREKIAEGKMQITQGMDGHGILIAPADKIINSFLPEKQKVIRFGADEDIFVTELEEHKNYLNFKTNFLDNEIKLPVTGKYNATNAMIASYVGKLLNVSEEKIISALAQLNLTRNRTEWKKAANGADILSDVYNANPTAMKLILETFSSIPANNGGKKIAVLADMKELGDSELALHAAMIASLDPAVIDRIFLFGPLMQALADEVAQVYSVGKWYYFAQADQVDELTEQIQKVLGPNDQILLKGSNSMKLAQVVECLEG